MKDRNGKFSVEGVLALVLFGIFALCVLAVLLLGARGYQRLTLRGQNSYDQRTAAQYIITRVHQADRRDAVSLNDGVLELTEVIDGDTYVTRVYCHEGYIRELFTPASLEFSPDAGECVLPAQAVDFELDGDLLSVVITHSNGETITLCMTLRSYGGGL